MTCPKCDDWLCGGLYEQGHCHANEACGSCQELENLTTEIVAMKLREIAEGPDHTGWFGGEEMEKCAQAIMKLKEKAWKYDSLAK